MDVANGPKPAICWPVVLVLFRTSNCRWFWDASFRKTSFEWTSGRRSQAEGLFNRRASWHDFRAALNAAFALRPELKSLATDDTLVCRCEDVTLARLKKFSGWRDAKLQTRCGMGC